MTNQIVHTLSRSLIMPIRNNFIIHSFNQTTKLTKEYTIVTRLYKYALTNTFFATLRTFIKFLSDDVTLK